MVKQLGDAEHSPPNQHPERWGADKLTQFQTYAQHNEFASFENIKQAHTLLINLDECLYEAGKFSIMHSHITNRANGFLLFITAQNHMRASVRLLTAGQCLSVYPVGRAALETALYGWLLLVEPKADEMWQNRPLKKDRDAVVAWSQYFKFSSISNKVKVINPEVDALLRRLHQLAIDFGAHPNKDALNSNMVFSTNGKGESTVAHIFLHQWGALQSQTLKFHLETGITILELIALAATDFERLMHISEKITQLKAEYHQLLPLLEAEVSS